MKELFPRHADELHREIKELLDFIDETSGLRKIVERALGQPGRSLSKGRRTVWLLVPLLVCEAICGRYEHATPAAAAIELAATAGDLLDDIQDIDSKDAWWQSCGEAQAINAATALLALSNQAAMSLRKTVPFPTVAAIVESINVATLKCCIGQHYDLSFETRLEVSEEMYLQMIGQKSASIIECACRIGALLATSEKPVVEAYAEFGHNLGMAAQIKNDALALTSVISAGADIGRRKKTLPVIYGLTHARGADQELLHRVYMGNDVLSPEQQAQIRRLLTRLGAVHYSMAVAALYKGRALEALEHPSIASHATGSLELLAGS